jgi:hypothetical protein
MTKVAPNPPINNFDYRCQPAQTHRLKVVILIFLKKLPQTLVLDHLHPKAKIQYSYRPRYLLARIFDYAIVFAVENEEKS